MKHLLGTFILAIGTFALACGLAYAEDTDTMGAQIDGSAICILSITSSDLSITAPTGVGPIEDVELTNSPIVFEITDNDATPVASTAIVTVVGSGTAPDQYLDGGTDPKYLIYFDEAVWTASADNDVTPVVDSSDALYYDSGAENVIAFGSSPTGSILHGTVSLPTYLYIDTDTRLRGDTSDSIVMQFTFTDF